MGVGPQLVHELGMVQEVGTVQEVCSVEEVGTVQEVCSVYTRSGYGILEVSVPYNFKWAKIRTMKGTDRLFKVAELSM